MSGAAGPERGVRPGDARRVPSHARAAERRSAPRSQGVSLGGAPDYPRGVEAARATPVERIYYDGECGLCHRWVRFVLARDRGRELFRFAPLAGPTCAARLPAAAREGLPDSVVVETAEGRLLVRSAAGLHVLRRLGGGWRALGRVLAWIPAPLRDWGYDRLAGVRKRLFARPASACPLVPPELARRFDP